MHQSVLRPGTICPTLKKFDRGEGIVALVEAKYRSFFLPARASIAGGSVEY